MTRLHISQHQQLLQALKERLMTILQLMMMQAIQDLPQDREVKQVVQIQPQILLTFQILVGLEIERLKVMMLQVHRKLLKENLK